MTISLRAAWATRTLILIVAMTVSVLVAYEASGLRATGLGVPVIYHGDGLSTGALVKGTLEHGWFSRNPDLGAPFGMSFHDYPMAESTHFAMIRALGAVSPTYAVAFNLFFLLGFATSALAAYFVLRHWRIEPFLAVAGALLFAWTPYHFLRTGHLLLASYYAVPILALVAMRALSGELPAMFALRERPIRVLGWVALLAACAGSGVYYAYFGCVLILFAGLSRAMQTGSWASLRWSLAPVAIIAFAVGANLIESILFRLEAGPNLLVAQRTPAEAEIYGLRLTQMLLPSPIHRISGLAELSAEYARTAPLVTENATASLGLLGSIGLLASLVACLMVSGRAELRFLSMVGALACAAFIYATIGGAGAVVAWTITPLIRGLNRISVFIAFFSIAALVWMFQALARRVADERQRVFAFVLSVGLVGIAWFDQVPTRNLQHASARSERFRTDETFARQVQALVPTGGCVYQLPYIPFPEHPPRYREASYDLLRPYLHSDGIAWSYGAMEGRAGAEWLESLERTPLTSRLDTLVAANFSAIYVQRDAYADGGFAVEQQLRRMLAPPAVVSGDRLRAVYALPAPAPKTESLPGSSCVGVQRVDDRAVKSRPVRGGAVEAIPVNGPIAREEVAVRLYQSGTPEHLVVTDELVLSIGIENRGKATLSSHGTLPVNLGIMLLAPDGSADHPPGNRDFIRVPIPTIAPGETAVVIGKIPAPPSLGLRLRLQLVQEQVAWFSDTYGQPALEMGPFNRCGAREAGICNEIGTRLNR